MPELPEVEAARLATRRIAGRRRITSVWCADDPIVFEGVSPARFRNALRGRRILDVHRHGKHLWLELDRRPWPSVHFGMAGGVHTRVESSASGARAVRLMSSRRRADGPVNASRDRGAPRLRRGAPSKRGEWGAISGPPTSVIWPPRFAKLRLTLDNGAELVIADARRLGRIRLRQDPASEPPIGLLGFDALLSMPPAAKFVEMLRARGAPTKAVLLDQSFSAGVGNWIADEVLYQARIDPRRRASTLSIEEARRVRRALISVIATAVQAGANSDRFPRSWLFHYRWEKGRGTSKTAQGKTIRYDTVGGRTTAWAPAVQR